MMVVLDSGHSRPPRITKQAHLEKMMASCGDARHQGDNDVLTSRHNCSRLLMPSPASTASPVVQVDYRGNDYRGFVFIVHDAHGLLLLRCTRKKNKPPHWQVPGGHVDEPEFFRAGECCEGDIAAMSSASEGSISSHAIFLLVTKQHNSAMIGTRNWFWLARWVRPVSFSRKQGWI